MRMNLSRLEDGSPSSAVQSRRCRYNAISLLQYLKHMATALSLLSKLDLYGRLRDASNTLNCSSSAFGLSVRRICFP